MHEWRLANSRTIALDAPALMAIVNCTPDSFYDGGTHGSVDEMVHGVLLSHQSGAKIVDVGGESTRPGAGPVNAAEQIRRTIPLIRALRARRDLDSLAISIDTTRGEVARAALEAGADAINDVSGLQDDRERMMRVLEDSQAGYVLMHRLAPPAADRFSDQYQSPPGYSDVVVQVAEFLQTNLSLLKSSGIEPRRIVLDPGLGFGKSVDQNLDLIRRTTEFFRLGRPVLSGLSRKSFVGRISLGRDSLPAERLEGTLALSVLHLIYGARVFRVHDVAACLGALRAAWAFLPPNPIPDPGI
ncbi:MAG: dihydropteroate synthase [Phycisphaeraceae bacterium]|nr:dihydropteroate synthase [Phycisphaeraceae bacterium]